MEANRADQNGRAEPPPSTTAHRAPDASSRSSHYHHHHRQQQTSTSRSSRYEAPPVSQGPLTAERSMMDAIRMKLERAQHRLAQQHAVRSATPGSSRYYPPNYTSAKARTPAPAVKSVKLEDFSLQQQQYVPQPPPSSTTSGYMGVYPPQPPSTYRGGFVDPNAASQRHHHHHHQPQQSQHRDRAAAPPTATTTSTRPSRQSVPESVREVPARSTRPSASHRQQYPPELQYKSSSRNTATSDYQGTPLSSAAPFLVYSTSQKSSRQPPSPMQVPAPSVRVNGASEADRLHRHHRHDRTREPPASAMRSAMQPPPSSRVRFAGDPDEEEEEERMRVQYEADRAREVEKAKARQREKEESRRELLRQERQKGALSHDDAEQQPTERQERTRRGSLPAPPKSEIDVNVFEQVKFGIPTSPTGRIRRTSSFALAAPPKSAIQASAFEDAPVRRRSSAADEMPPHKMETSKEEVEKTSTKRELSSDEDDYKTPPTSPSSGGSGSSGRASVTEEPRHTSPESTSMPEAPIPVNVQPPLVNSEYDQSLFVKPSASPSKKFYLSIWDETDEEAIISSSNDAVTPKQQTPKAALIWDEEAEEHEEEEEDIDGRNSPMPNQKPSPVKEETPEKTTVFKKVELASPSNQEDNSENVAPLNHDLSPKAELTSEISSNQELSPEMKPVSAQVPPSSSAYLGSRIASPARPDLRSRISAAIQAFNSPEAAVPKASRSPPPLPPSVLSPPPPASPPSLRLQPASEPRALPTTSMMPSRSSAAFQRPPSTTVSRPSVTRPRAPLVPPAPPTTHTSRSHLPPPPSRSTLGSQTQRHLRHREPQELRRQLPPQIAVLSGLSSGPITFPLDEYSFYEIVWRTGEFGFSFQRVYSEEHGDYKSEMFLRMLLNTDRGTCRSFHDVRVGDILIKIGDTKVSDLGFDTARDPGSALTKYFTELRMQTPIRLVFQRTEVLDWEGGVEL